MAKIGPGVLLLSLYLGFPGTSLAGDIDAVNGFQQSIGRIKSYDVTICVTMLDYSQTPAKPKIVDAETNRDVFAMGLGRRIERSVKGEPFGIGVIDWKTVASMGPRLNRTLTVVMPGLTYLDYLNPSPGDGFFLTDVLDNRRISIRPLEESDASGLIGFEAENPRLQGAHTVIRFWLDPSRGNILSRMDWYEQTGPGMLLLQHRMEVDKFIKVDDLYVPDLASMADFSHGKKWTAYVMALDEKKSSFNSIDSNALFVSSGLSGANHKEAGWTWEYPPAILSQVNASDLAIKHLRNEGNLKYSRAVVYAALALITSLLVIFAAWQKKIQKESHI